MSLVCNLSEINGWGETSWRQWRPKRTTWRFRVAVSSGERARVIFAPTLGTVFEWYDLYLYVVLEERRILVRGRKEQLRACRRTARLRSSQASCLRGWPHDGNQNCSPEAIERLERNLRRCGGVMPPRAAGGAQPGSRAMRPRRLARLSHTSSASQQSAFHGPGQRGRRGSSPTRARLHDKFPPAH